MPEILCPNCGKENPDFFDACQFCQTSLQPDDTLHAGDTPLEKDTGELEQILPEWLQDARQQNRESDAAETFSPETRPRVKNTEPVDLLAGLASQGDSDEEDEDVPDWLSAINPVKDTGSLMLSNASGEEEPSDFFAQFSQTEAQPSEPIADEMDQDDAASLMGGMEQQDSAQTDELAGWFSQEPSETDEPLSFGQGEADAGDDSSMDGFGLPDLSQPESPAEKEPEDLSWLHDLEATAKETGELPSSQVGSGFDFPPAQQESSQGDLSWLNELGGTPISSTVEPSPSEPASAGDDLGWLNELGGVEQPGSDEPVSAQAGSSQEDLGWLNELGNTQSPGVEESSPAQSEAPLDDLDWMKNLGDAQDTSVAEESASVQAGAPAEDLDWLNNLGSTETSAVEEPASVQAEAPAEDLGWLNELGDAQSSVAEEPASVQSEASLDDLDWMKNLDDPQSVAAEESVSVQAESPVEDLDWLNNLGGTEAKASEEPSSALTETSHEDLGWLNDLGGTQSSVEEEVVPAQSETSLGDLDWMKNLGDTSSSVAEESVSTQSEASDDLDWMKNLGNVQETPVVEASDTKFTPPGTKPLDDLTAGIDTTPDWLKSAMEEPSMPAPGELSMDWFANQEKPAESDETSVPDETFDAQSDEIPAPTLSEADSPLPDLDLPFGDSSAAPAQDLDAMFNIDMPDWASEEAYTEAEMSEDGATDTPEAGGEDLAPVELPSWVQAMRPVDSVIADETSSALDYSDQEPESEGPLAGFSGVIPSAPIGSSLRPKALSLKLQVTDEQQVGASLIEQIIASETVAPPLKSNKVAASQRTLRWVLSALFLVVLGIVLGLGWQNFPILASGQVSELSNLVGTLPDEAPVLLVMDYDPAVAGEMASAAGPVLDQLAASKHAAFTFLSTSPNSSAMVEALLSSTKITRPISDDPNESGLEYQVGVDYSNAGFLPGGSAGVQGFIADPVKIMPNVPTFANVTSFSDFEAVVLLTDNADSGRVWVEQLELARQTQPEIANMPLVIVSSAQAGPMLRPYVSSDQVDIMINGLYDAAQYEYVNQSRPGIARRYWDSFGAGLAIAIFSIVLGGIWNMFVGMRERRAEAEQE